MSETNKCFASNCERNCPKMISQILSETSKCFASRPFQTIFGSNVLWSGLVTLWRNCALSSFHNFECIYCSKKREGSLEAVRECTLYKHRSYYVVCFAMISSLQLISSSVSKAAATYKRAAARSSYCAQLLSFSRIFSWKSSLPNNFKLLDYILNYYIMDNTVTNP